MNTLKLDHIVYAVPDLDEGIRNIHEKLGVMPVYGGRHLLEGTHNALLMVATLKSLHRIQITKVFKVPGGWVLIWFNLPALADGQ